MSSPVCLSWSRSRSECGSGAARAMHIDLRWRVLAFVAVLLGVAAAPIADWLRLPIACAVYLIVVFPVLFKEKNHRDA